MALLQQVEEEEVHQLQKAEVEVAVVEHPLREEVVVGVHLSSLEVTVQVVAEEAEEHLTQEGEEEVVVKRLTQGEVVEVEVHQMQAAEEWGA